LLKEVEVVNVTFGQDIPVGKQMIFNIPNLSLSIVTGES
jgi:hypothetical protein